MIYPCSLTSWSHRQKKPLTGTPLSVSRECKFTNVIEMYISYDIKQILRQYIILKRAHFRSSVNRKNLSLWQERMNDQRAEGELGISRNFHLFSELMPSEVLKHYYSKIISVVTDKHKLLRVKWINHAKNGDVCKWTILMLFVVSTLCLPF